MTLASIPTIARLVAAASPAVFKALDTVCDALITADSESKAIQVFHTACEVRKATKRRPRR